MADKATLTMAGLILLLTLTNGAQYYLNETGTKAKCDNGVGWQFQETGINQGKYMCQSATPRYEYCGRVTNTTGSPVKQNYWCYVAVAVVVPQNQPTIPPTSYEGLSVICPPNNQTCEVKQ